MIRITHAATPDDLSGAREIMADFLRWDLAEFQRTSGVALEIEAYLANSLDNIEAYMPPRGRFAMARDAEGRLLGIALMKPLGEADCEIKRMYVDPAARGHGLGRRMLAGLLEAAREIGYRAAYLDTASYMTEARGLYTSLGFHEIDVYPGGENEDPELAAHLTFMRCDLAEGNAS